MNKKNTNTIEIKGQLYNAVNGIPLQPGTPTPAQSSVAIPIKHIPSTHTIKQSTAAHRRHPAKDVAHHAPTNSQILMRSIVKKPASNLKRHLKISESTDQIVSKTSYTAAHSHMSLAAQHHERSQRAATIQQSERISHFVTPSVNPTPQSFPSVIATEQSLPQAAAPAPAKSPTDLLIERALSQATSPEQPPPKATKLKWSRVALMTAPVVIVALLIIGSRSVTDLQLRVASAKAGFSTSLPAYHPAGYSLGQLSYNSGIFASEYHTNGSTESYTVTQKKTSWDSQTLLDNYVLTTAARYQIVQLGTRTVYLYNDGNATWINGNIWYQLNSDGSLNESQIINVVNSL